MIARIRAEILRRFAGLDVVEPGVVHVRDWRPDSAIEGEPSLADTIGYAAVGRKP